MTPALRAEVAHLFDVEANHYRRLADLTENLGRDVPPWWWDDEEVPHVLRSVPALRAEVTRLRREARR